MIPRQLLSNLTPEWARPAAIKLAAKLRRRRQATAAAPPISEDGFRDLLRERLGVVEGATVFVHSSAASLRTEFPFYRVLALLREVVGPEGTLLFPSWHYHGRAEDHLAGDPVFDVRRSPTTMGIIAEFGRRLDGAVRSLHPTNSVVAVGPLADELTRDHPRSVWPCGPESPIYRVSGSSGIILGLGVSAHNLSFVHAIEDELQDRFPVEVRSPIRYEGRVRGVDGREHVVPTLVHHRRIRWRNVEGFLERHVTPSAFEAHRIGGASFFRADAPRLLDEMRALARRDITIYWKAIHRDTVTARWIR